ncbi:hypothetical protein ENUP19_0254G0015 [Entamoeba nuttalli]|uniref:Uncharacterized protein n=2 Tax=Entamoeba nuttalli TaxID=412467 RepID=K2HF33_ENTNP|nr:hypothetical protein ENU1_056260 [Entamoeba nuttalli P19]EKE41434.1 hypothetical protein ENU1_056260 [Entamoeba nuttalli P19]|eukprot:XP_008856231.1 hypothetical protein ENU1_056260 [Entamoeba nuttalli P19]
MKNHLIHILLLFFCLSNGEELPKCEIYTLCTSCTEVQGDEFRPVARGCVWCEQSFKSYCSYPASSNCTIANRKTFGKCGFSWVPVVIIILVFGFLFFVYGVFIMIIKQCEYNTYQKVLAKNEKEMAFELITN